MAGYFSKRLAQGIHDPLEANCLWLAPQGGKALLLCALDLLVLDVETALKVRKAAAEAAGMPLANCLVHCTHIHTGPATVSILGASQAKKYVEQLPGRVAQAAAEAREKAEQVELRAARLEAPGLTFNRRFLMQDGTVATNPGVGNPAIIRPAGPVDEELQVLFGLIGEKPRFALLNFACHPDMIGGDRVSAGYPGFTRRYFEEIFPGSRAAFFNGFCGDLNHIDVNSRLKWHSGFEVAQQHGQALAAAAARALHFAEPVAIGPVQALDESVKVQRRKPDAELLERARTQLCKPGSWEVDEARFAALAERQLLEASYLREALELRLAPESEAVPLWAAAAGEIAWCGISAEVFNSYQVRLKEAAPFKWVLPVELANGWCGYLPTPEAFREGGYEIRLARSSRLEAGAGEILYQVLHQRLEALRER